MRNAVSRAQNSTIMLNFVPSNTNKGIKMSLRNYIILSLLLCCCGLQAQEQQVEPFARKKLVKEVKIQNKAEKYDKSSELLRKAFAQYPEAANDAELCNYELTAQMELAKQQSRAIFLNQKPDTARYFGHILEAYRYALRTDSLDRLPDAKERIKPKFTSNVSTTLTDLRNNLRSGGKYFYKKREFERALPYFETYLQTLNHPLVQFDKLKETTQPLDVDSVEIARLTMISAFSAQRYDKVLQYEPIAMQDTVQRALLLELTAKSCQQLGYELRYLQTIQQGFEQYPLHEYFYTTLLSHYNNEPDYHQSLTILNRLLELQPRNRKFLYLKGKMLQGLHQLEEAAQVFQETIQVMPDDAEAHASLGNVYLQQAHDFYNNNDLKIGDKNYAKHRRQLNEYYTRAMKAYEQARQFGGDTASALWLSGLRETYYKLNKGRELKVLEKTYGK